MSFANTQLPVRLPVFKDKVMYISPANNKNKIEQSYVISASFKGILRLSPNNYNTIYENNPIELTAEQDASISSSYSDAIVFENEALDNTKTNADITQRFIIGSDSDGYLVNFRFSDKALEFNNLGVIGITKTKELIIYSNARSSDKQALTLGSTIMPSLPNELTSSRTELINLLSNGKLLNDEELGGNNEDYKGKYPENFDEIQIDITGDGDKSYLLHGTISPDGQRTFEYKRSQQFIRDVIMETLLSIQSVPTGSIHWFPVTYEQYESLVNKGHQYPNHYFKKNGTNDTDNPADPLIRDYLLCDGRKYKSSDFPELAKILYKENINYWDYKGNINEHTNGSSTTQGQEVKIDTYFRVPDLRTKFISYVYAPSVLNSLDEEAYNTHSHKNDDWNITGVYTPDNSPKYPSGQTGEHFHFLAYGTYNGYNIKGALDNDFYKFKGYQHNQPIGNEARIWYLSTTAGGRSRTGSVAHQPGGYSYGFGCSGNRRRDQSSVDAITACAFVSAPKGGYKSHQQTPTVGLTSESQMIYEIPVANSDTYKITEYESWNDYQPLEKGISFNNTNEYKTRYGYENAPKFYAFLPLIRI